ncbi:hypothetical protein E2A64_16255 [Pseudohoeflea suaedae]|uniref:Uncharacterized protein n=1 Tax=Pseudohoeflea suaedae TaxID=877384 RepID=A0A4R5PH67_9HYPH|nr:hypothetical protein [Pseudohoeflea suaedae]TDH34228.1 hypothetical protein E2A64_16255 [Pseudohoeflea suaedae]
MISAVMSTALSGMKAQQDRAAAQADTVANYTRPDTTSKDVVSFSRAGGTITASTQQLPPPEAAASAVAAGQKLRTPQKPDLPEPDEAGDELPKTELPIKASWPNPMIIQLPPVVLDLMETQEAFRASVAEFDTGAEFWDMLEVAADQGHPRRDP